ncbi:MAG: hypothetical protein QOJ19_393 [Acidimicrobiia bacterium]|jgi:predicted DNA-binding protein (MmcQ/YjbR family)|nr:hypothetical protein [Acidimicrobiia bacterium]
MGTDPVATMNDLLAWALGLPGAFEDHPWDSAPVVKVNKKIFAFFGQPPDPGVAVKLPESADIALGLDCTKPTGYGLGRSGWVSIDFSGPDLPSFDVLSDWLEESYRAIAPKRLSAQLDATAVDKESETG